MTAPERIWAYSDGLWIEAWDAPPSGAEYIRADLPAVTVGVKPDRETFDAMCAMRDAINEFVPMPSLESDLLQGPENSVFCSTVAEAVIAEIRRLRAALIPVTAPERIWTASTNGKCHVGFDAPSLNYTNEYIRADLAAVQPAQVLDLIPRMDAIQACQVGPSDEWAKATKSGYEQAATDCARNILKIKTAALEPQPDPRDEVIKRLLEALSGIEYACNQVAATRTHDVYLAMIDSGQADALLALDSRRKSARAALAAAKAVMK